MPFLCIIFIFGFLFSTQNVLLHDVSGTSISSDLPGEFGLNTDEQIRNLANYDIDNRDDNLPNLQDIPCLDVVPSGKAYPRYQVFQSLGLDETRIRDFRTEGWFSVEFLKWQVSPSYDIQCMTSYKRLDLDLELNDPQRIVYGIRLLKRKK